MLFTATADTLLFEHILSIIVCILVLCFAIIIVYGTLREKIKKETKKKTEAYDRSVHVKTVMLTDPIFFGTIEAEFDDRTGILKAEQVNLPQFGSGKPNQILVEDYQDADRDEILRILNRAYDRCDEILTKMAEMLLRGELAPGDAAEVVVRNGTVGIDKTGA